MVVALQNFYLYRTHFGLLSAGKHLNGHLQKNCVRQKRGSRSGFRNKRYGDDLGQSLAKIVEEVFAPTAFIDEAISRDDSSKAIENTYKKLDEKITPLKDIGYTYQLEKKHKKSLGVLRFFGEKLHSLNVPIGLGKDNLPCPVDLTVKSPLVESYRNQDEFSIGPGLDGNPKTVGFCTDTMNDLCLSPEKLIIIKESHKKLAKDFQNYLKDSPLAASVKHDDGGYWRSLKIRSNTENELMGIIAMNAQELTKENLNEEADRLREYFLAQKPYYLKSLYLQTVEQKSGNSNPKLDLLFGDSCIIETFRNMKLQISPGSYFPSNTRALEELYNSLLKVCRINEETTILDIFCGTGPLSLTLSPRVKKSIGIDCCTSSIHDAKANAVLNGMQNTQFVRGDIDILLNQILNSSEYHNELIAVINPARNEITSTAINSLRACSHLKKIIYITTIPKSAIGHYIRLCRPAGSFKELGKYFVPLLAIPVDLFPQTNRFGLITMFQR